VSVRILFFGLAACAFSSSLCAKECTFNELADQEGQVATMTAKIKGIESAEDNPKQFFITVDNEGTDHCFSFITGLPKASLGNCAVGKTATATGKVHEGMDAWWGLEKVTSIRSSASSRSDIATPALLQGSRSAVTSNAATTSSATH